MPGSGGSPFWATAKDRITRKRPELRRNVAVTQALWGLTHMMLLGIGVAHGAPGLTVVGAGGMAVGVGAKAWAAHRSQGRIAAARQQKEAFGPESLDTSADTHQAESDGYRITKSYSPPEDVQYRVGVLSALDGLGRDRTNWTPAKLEGYRKGNAVLYQDRALAIAYERGCGRLLNERGQMDPDAPAGVGSTFVAAPIGGGVAALRAAVNELAGAADLEIKSLSEAYDAMEDLESRLADHLGSSAAGRDLMEALDAALVAVRDAITRLAGAAMKARAFAAGLAR